MKSVCGFSMLLLFLTSCAVDPVPRKEEAKSLIHSWSSTSVQIISYEKGLQKSDTTLYSPFTDSIPVFESIRFTNDSMYLKSSNTLAEGKGMYYQERNGYVIWTANAKSDTLFIVDQLLSDKVILRVPLGKITSDEDPEGTKSYTYHLVRK